MNKKNFKQETLEENIKNQPSNWGQFWQTFAKHRGALVGLVFLIFFLLCTLFASQLAPYDPLEQFRDHMLVPPAWVEGGVPQFLLGTDEIGRDMLSRLIYGGRFGFIMGLLVVSLSLGPGLLIGLMVAFFPKVFGSIIMRIMDILMALPSLLLALVMVAILGQGIFNATIALAIAFFPYKVRLVRSMAMSEINKEYVMASRIAGASTWRLMFVTVLPNCMAPILVTATAGLSFAILSAAGLSFIGLGVQPPTADWGAMLTSAKDYIESAWWLIALPSVLVVLLVLSINLIGDGLRDALDPKLKRNLR